MKKRIILLLAMLAAIVVLAVGFTIGTSAQTYNVSNASDFTSKINSAASGDVINVTANISVGSTHTITKNLTITSTNGSTVTATVDNLFSVGSDASTSGNLTIDGNVTLARPSNGTIVRMVNGTLTVQGNATLTSSWTTVRMATDGGLAGTAHVYVKDNATVEATIDNENDYAFYVNGGGKANLHIQGGTVRHTAGYAISFPAGNIEVSGGTVTGMYGIYTWYDAGSAVKTITVSGGEVTGSVTGIYFKENTKNCTVNVTGGTVSGTTHAIDCRSTKDSPNNAINVSGGTVTAEGQTMFFYRCTAVTLTVTGGTIEASNGGLTIYGAELRGNLTLNLSGTGRITATGNDTINVTMPGNTSTYPGVLKATINNGTISAGGEHAINVQNGSVTMTGGTVSASTGAIYANKEGGSISISGGTVTAGSNTIAFDAAGTRTLNISGTAQIIATGNVAILGTASATPTITISDGSITAGGDFCIDTRGGTVRIEGGTLSTTSTWGFYVRGSVAYTITGGTMKAAGTLFGFSGATNASLNITGGTFILNGSGNGAFVGRPGSTSGCTITINGGLFVDYSSASIANLLVAASLDSGNTISLLSGRVLYKDGVTNLITGTSAPKNEYTLYDTDGNGVYEASEIFYFYDPTASAQTYNVSNEAELTSAFISAKTGSTINITASFSMSSQISAFKMLILTSSNSSTITATVENPFSVGLDSSHSGNLTIQGNLTVTSSSGTVVRMVNGTLTMQGSATLSSNYTTIRMASDGGVAGNCYVYIKGNAVVEATSANESDNVMYVNDASRANLFIQGGTVRNTLGRGISLPGGKITVSGGLLTAKYGMYVWYSSAKTITVSGGTVEGSITGIYYNTNAKNASLTVSSGTVSGGTHAIDYRVDQNSANNAINISGGTLTAPSQTMFFYRCTALTVAVTGGTIRATDGGLTIYGAELRGDLTFNVSGASTGITSTDSNTINVTMPGNTSTYPGKLVATISGGTISTGNEHAINVQNGSVTITGGTISASSAAIYANKAGGSISISGGTVTANSNTIAFQDAGTRTLNISGTAIVRTTSGESTILATSGATPTITITGGTITASSNFCINTQGGTVNISGGTLTAGGYCTYLRGDVSYSISGGKLTAAQNAVFALSSKTGVTLNTTGGTFILNGNGNGAKIIADVGSSENSTVTINGGVFVNNNTENYTIVAAFGGEGNTVSFNSGRVLYRKNLDSITSTSGNAILASKTAYAVYDANGNGKADDGETYYFFAKFPATNASYSGVMTSGASVRLAQNNGIRFTTEYSSSVVNALKAKGSVTYGTIIVPTTYLAQVNAFTKAALDAAGIDYANIVAYDGLVQNGGGYTVRAALTDLNTKNYGLSFSAVSYALVNGTYYYSAYNTTNNARTMSEIAQAALDDLKSSSQSGYSYQTSVYGVTVYTPYYPAQRTTLEGYIAVAVDVPVLAGKTKTLLHTGDDTYEYYYTSATSANYTTYKSTLSGAGYTLFAEKTMDSNKFATYTGKGKILTLSYIANKSEIRLIMEMDTDTALPTTSAENSGYGTGKTTTVTQIGLWYTDQSTESHKSYYFNSTWGETRSYATAFTSGMCYVIRLCDGSFIVIDGGYATATHAENLYNVMKKQAGSDTFTIAAWIFTHVHDDHAGAFRVFTENKKYQDLVTIERFIYNFPSEAAHLANDYGGTNSQRNDILRDMTKYVGAKQTVGHAGQEFYIRNAKINILFAAELMEPHRLEYYNSECMVFQIELEGKKLLFFGDCGGNSEKGGSEMAYVNAIYTATTLKSDFVQVAHHGLDPETDSDGFSLTNFYKNKVQPTYVFIPVASEYVKIGDSYVIIQQRNESYIWGRTKYLGRDDVVVVTLNNGSVSASTYDTVSAYIG